MEDVNQAPISARLSSADDVIDALGGTKKVAQLLDVGASSVSNYRKSGFPARTHFVLSKICTEHGLDVADAVFGGINWDKPTTPRAASMSTTSNAGGVSGNALDLFVANGFTPLDTPMLQPAAPFINRMGGEMQRRLYTFNDPAGEQLCLRPDLTIPTALDYINQKRTGEARYCYQGTAFRYQPRGSGKPEEFTQLGLEIIGGTDPRQDTETILRLIFEQITNAGLNKPGMIEIHITDYEFFTHFLDALDLLENTKAKIRRHIDSAENLEDFERLLAEDSARAKLARASISYLESHHIEPEQVIAGRSSAEINQRMSERNTDAEDIAIPDDKRDELLEFLKSLHDSQFREKHSNKFLELENWSGTRIIELILNVVNPALNGADGLSHDTVQPRSVIGQKLAYYTEFSFEIRATALSTNNVIATGGRYDDLLQSLGADAPTPAIGGAIALERLAAAVAASA